MSLLPIIYTSLAIFFGTFITILIISYISYKFKSGKKEEFVGHESIHQNSFGQQQKLAHVPIYNINNNKSHQMNNSQTRKRVDYHYKEPNNYNTKIKRSTTMQVRERGFDTVVSKPRIQVVKRLSRPSEEPIKLPIQNSNYSEASLYRYYAQG